MASKLAIRKYVKLNQLARLLVDLIRYSLLHGPVNLAL